MVKRTDSPQRPRLPRDLPLSTGIVADVDLDLIGLTIEGDFSDQRFPGLTLEESRIAQASFVGADLRRIRLVDVLVEGADLSGADLEEASFSRVEFVNCRMSGVQIARATMQDVTFSECKLDGANFRMTEADRIVFDHASMREVEFSAGHLDAACFFDSDLGGADFSQAVTPGARFHGSSLADIKGGEYLRDIVIDSSQTLPLALRVFMALGIQVDDDRGSPESELNRHTHND